MADITRCEDPADPNRCQAVAGGGDQCSNIAAPESKFCMAHGGNRAANLKEQKELRNYRRGKWLAQIHEHADSSGLKSLREEIGILRVLMQERLEQCNDSMDLIHQSQQIADLVMKIEHVVSACHKLDDKLKRVVDRSQLLQFAATTIDVIATFVPDEVLLQKISDKILVAIGQLGEDDV